VSARIVPLFPSDDDSGRAGGVREKLGLSIGDHIGKTAGLIAKGRKILSVPTRQQHNACARNDLLRRLAIGDEPLQCSLVTGPDVQACMDVSHAAVKSDLQARANL
jgi:hypothetical protein